MKALGRVTSQNIGLFPPADRHNAVTPPAATEKAEASNLLPPFSSFQLYGIILPPDKLKSLIRCNPVVEDSLR